MKPSLVKLSGLRELKLPMKPSNLGASIQNPTLKVKEQTRKVLQTYKAP